MVLAIPFSPTCLSKAIIDLTTVPTTSMAQNPVENWLSIYVLVKSQLLKIVQGPRGLGYRITKSIFHVSSKRIPFLNRPVPQKRNEVASRG